MKIAVIGAGLMGRAALYDLARAEGVEKVGIFDIDQKLAEQVATQYGDGIAVAGYLDAGDVEAVSEIMKEYDIMYSYALKMLEKIMEVFKA